MVAGDKLSQNKFNKNNHNLLFQNKHIEKYFINLNKLNSSSVFVKDVNNMADSCRPASRHGGRYSSNSNRIDVQYSDNLPSYSTVNYSSQEGAFCVRYDVSHTFFDLVTCLFFTTINMTEFLSHV